NQGGSENITDAQVEDEVRILNRDYNKQNADTANAVSNFKYIIANMNVQWRLANIDPWGNCTNGIDRVNSDQTYVGDDYSKLNGWPREKYMNVWVVRQMGGGAAGYAYYPADVAVQYSVPSRDGVIILHNYIGSIGTGSTGSSRALTHEIGHCFSLQHCWGNNNNPGQSCGDDEVEDTPPTKGWLYCPSASGAQVCQHGVIENYQNYMEYSYCSIMFTEGQKARWLASANSSIAGRNNLWSDSNLVATGTSNTTRTPCAPIANFNVSKRTICSGSSVTFINTSGNADSMDYYWEFPTGNPSTATTANVQVTFSTPGWQPATLTVSNAYGQSTKSDTTLVYVAPEYSTQVAPYREGFENPGIFDGIWATSNYDASNTYDNNITWFKQTTSASHTGSGSVVLNNYYAHANHDVDEIISPGIDMRSLTSSQKYMTFYYSWATSNQYYNNLPDSLIVWVSANCGTSWNAIYRVANTTAVNAGYVQGYFVPTQTSAFWKKVTINISSLMAQAHVIFRFQAFTSVQGNNLYIDDINIGDDLTTGIDENSLTASNVQLFPNPTGGNATLIMNLASQQHVGIKVFDITGKQVLNVFDGAMDAGDNTAEIKSGALASGVYVVSIQAGQSVIERKLVIK
ncbi:MAG TPA: M43 family zinc metalloprotease, partial [Chitinophagales bacterium]|nr:M43 family zinc metalloprotease [Chitinophagales bacterium]